MSEGIWRVGHQRSDCLALYWMYAIYWYDALFQFGILLFISFLFWGLLCKVSNDIQYRMEQAVYERMSIEDG